MTRDKIERELDKLTLELARVKMMNEQEACEFCNTDSKAEAIEAYETEIALFKMDLQELDEEEAREESDGIIDTLLCIAAASVLVLGIFWLC